MEEIAIFHFLQMTNQSPIAAARSLPPAPALACGRPREGANERAKRHVGRGSSRPLSFPEPSPVPPADVPFVTTSVGHTYACPFPASMRYCSSEWARLARLPTHRLLTGVPPWQRDDPIVRCMVGSAPGPEAKAQSESAIGIADVTSHEKTTKKRFESWGRTVA